MSSTAAFGLRFETVGVRYILERLTARYRDRHSVETIHLVVKEAELKYRDARIHAFVPLLVEREARRVLDQPDPPTG